MIFGIQEIAIGFEINVSNDPFFSVIIPTFNRAYILSSTIKSVLRQSFQDFEIWVIDNGSTDNTDQVVGEFEDHRVHYIRIGPTGGPAAPRNVGMSHARGTWLAFLDSDDLWYPDKLSMVKEKAVTGNYELISHYQLLQDNSGKEKGIMGRRLDGNPTYFEFLTTENTFATSSVCVNRDFLEKNNIWFREDKSYRAIEDYDLWLRVLRGGGRGRVIQKILGSNVDSVNNLGVDSIFFENMSYLIEDHSEWLNKKNAWDQTSIKNYLWANLAMRQGFTAARQKEYRKAFEKITKAVFSSPKSAISYLYLRIRQRIYFSSKTNCAI